MTAALTAPAGVRRSTPYSPELEALRGFAILLVLLYHTDELLAGRHGYATGSLVSPLRAFVTAGHTGVTLFFVLSAFLLARPFLAEAGGGRRVRLRDFYARRALRILPLYYAAIAAAVWLRHSAPAVLGGGFEAALFLNSFSGLVEPLVPYSTVWWSLATEVQFYLLLPLLGLCIRSPRGRRLGVALLVVYAASYAASVSGVLRPADPALHQRLMLSAFGRAPAFLAGIAAAWVTLRHGPRLRERLAGTRWVHAGAGDAALVALLLLLGFLLRAVTWRGFFPAENHWHAWHVAEAALWAGVVLLFVLVPLRARGLLVNRATVALGVVSYSLYLWHYPLLSQGLAALRRAAPGLVGRATLGAALAALLLLGLCLVLSAATYRFVERPFLLRKARIDR